MEKLKPQVVPEDWPVESSERRSGRTRKARLFYQPESGNLVALYLWLGGCRDTACVYVKFLLICKLLLV